MNVLVLDTAGVNLNVALHAGGKEYFISDKSFKKASESLLNCIENLLFDANLELRDIDFFAVSVGPGSFTGIRIGVTTVKAFCYALNKKAMPVTRHDYLAYNVRATEKIVITDAGNGLCYVGTYDSANKIRGEIEVINKNDVKPVKGATAFYETEENCLDNGKKLLNYALSAYSLKGESALIDHNNLSCVYIRQCQAEKDRNER